MAAIPSDIKEIINRVQRQGDQSSLSPTEALTDKCHALLTETFPEWQVVNITDFDYGRSSSYIISLTSDRDAAALDEEPLIKAINKAGEVAQLNVAISAIAPYVDIQFIRYVLADGEIIEEQATEPSTKIQLQALERLLLVLAKQGIRRISPEVAAINLPEIQTELSDDVTVADCLFYG